jgi:hypothetical protein
MMKSRSRPPATLALCLFLVLGTAQAFADDVEPFTGYLDLKANGLGGYHAALADDFSVLFSNPAGLVVAKPEFSAARLDIGLSGPIFDIATILVSSSDYTTDLVNLLVASGYKMYAAVDLAGPLSLGYVGEGLGFGIFNRTRVVINASSVSDIKVSLAEELLINGGYAFRIPTGAKSALDIGLVAKGYIRGSFLLDGGILELQSLLMNTMAILSEPFVLTTGIGVDAGIRWNHSESFAVGLSCRDAFSPAFISTYSDFMSFISDPSTALVSTSTGLIPPNLTLGFMVRPKFKFLEKVFDEVTFLLDYEDILDLFKPVPRNPILNVDAGVEFKVLQILSIRLGFREALPQAGVDFDLDALRIGVSAWGDELGYEPGQRSVYNIAFAFDFVY